MNLIWYQLFNKKKYFASINNINDQIIVKRKLIEILQHIRDPKFFFVTLKCILVNTPTLPDLGIYKFLNSVFEM